MNNRFTRFLIFAFLILPILGFSQTDFEFWFVAPAVTFKTVPPSTRNDTNLNRPIRLYCTTAEGPATVTVDQPANPNFIPILRIVNNDSARAIDLTPFLEIIENKPANTVLPYGIRIRSNKRINCFYEIQSPMNAATYSLSGKNALGYEFIIPAQNHYPNYPWCNPPARNVFDIVATEDSTTVHVIPVNDIVGHQALDTFAIFLNRGQTWSGRAASGDSSAHLGGSYLFSNKPIAVTVTDDAVYFPNTEAKAYDISGDQITPKQLGGKEFIVRSGTWNGSQPIRSSVLVYAYEDTTHVTYNDSASFQNKTLNRGEHAEFLFPNATFFTTWQPGYIFSDKPVLAYAMTVFAGSQAGPSSPQAGTCIVPPVNDCSGSHRVTLSFTSPFGGQQNYWDLFIFIKNGNQGYFSCTPFWMCNSIIFSPVPGTGGEWVWGGTGCVNCSPLMNTIFSNPKARFALSGMSDDFVINTAAYTKFSFFTDVTSLNLGTDRNLCPGDSLFLDAGIDLNMYTWSTGAHTPGIWVKLPGTYWVDVTDGICALSDTIAVSYYWTSPVNLGPDTVLCPGDSILLDAGSKRAWYLWNTGDTTQTIWAKNSGTYWVRAQDAHCVVSDTIYIETAVPPIVTNNPMSKFICSGESTNITLTSNVPGTNFYWTATLTSGNISGFSPNSGLVINQVLVNSLSTAGIVTYHITPNAGSCSGTTVDFPVTVNPADSVKVSISASDNNICSGTLVTFTAVPTNGGTTPVYQWKVNSIGVGISIPTYFYMPVNVDIVTCTLTSSNTVCTANNPAISNAITMIVNPLNPVSVSINTPDNPFCQGSTVNFTATLTNGGTTPTYLWKVNGVGVGTNNPVYSYIPANGDLVTCVMNSNIACPTGNPATSDTITMVENTVNPVSIVITTPVTTICSGISVTFTATPTNGGTTPAYQWKVNGVNTGANNSQFTYTPVNGDCISCILTSNLICASGNPATSNSICMIVNPNLPVSISISTPITTLCAGTQVTFTASPTNQGTLPQYQWKVNGVGVGTSSLTYSYIPVNGDQVSCVLTSNAICPTGNPATSNTITMTVNANLPVSVVISASNNPVCSGIPITYTAIPTNGGTTPVYLWKVNGIIVGTNSTTYQYIPVNGDLITCTLTSNLTCTTGNPATSNTITMGVAFTPIVTFTRCNDSITTINAQPFRLKGGIPLGGTYSGTGVTNGIFYPAIAGVGSHQINYSYTNATLCSGNAFVTIVTRNASPVTCGNPLTDIRDNKVYPTVQIGSQCWFAANLNYGTMIPGAISQRDNCLSEKYCFNDLPTNCGMQTYYQWDELMQYDETLPTQGFCPPGWHVPTEADWNTLFSNYISNAFAAWPLLSTGYSGFNATLSATRHQNKTWDWSGFATFFWSSTPHGNNKAWSHGMNDTDPSVSIYPAFRSNAFSVRCLRD
ncbi:MAG: hypothetical protein NTX61_12175 [Bacteroidetes bacterium]|nr:hypothetical protein [Bacteroidota bacterium]